MKKIFLLALLISLTAFACDNNQTLARDQFITIKGKTYSVQLADTPEKQAAGLSGIKSISDTEGMLFTFSAPQQPGFWMKGMLFPIDIVWINDNRIVQITDNIPTQPGLSESELTIYRPNSNVDKVLEVKAGWAFRHDINVGDTLTIANP